jgi:hypothetical protein
VGHAECSGVEKNKFITEPQFLPQLGAGHLGVSGVGMQAEVLLDTVSNYGDSSSFHTLMDQVPTLPFTIHDNMRGVLIEEMGDMPHAPVQQGIGGGLSYPH